jgi:hypothetical protein
MQVQCGGPSYQVQLGRRDGMVSQASMASILPGPNVDVPTAIDLFARKGLNSFEMVSLMGTCTSVAVVYATAFFLFNTENKTHKKLAIAKDQYNTSSRFYLSVSVQMVLESFTMTHVHCSLRQHEADRLVLYIANKLASFDLEHTAKRIDSVCIYQGSSTHGISRTWYTSVGTHKINS